MNPPLSLALTVHHGASDAAVNSGGKNISSKSLVCGP